MLSDELKYINAVIGLCKSTGFWPDPFARFNYETVGVEREVSTIVNGQVRTVVPELICASTVTNHVFCLEVKSASFRQGQAEGYEAITPQQIYAQNLLPPGFAAGGLSRDVFFVTLQTNVQKLTQLMTTSGTSLPLVADDGQQFILVWGAFDQSDFQREFAQGIRILSTHQWPTHFVLFNSKAPIADLAAPVMRGAARFLLRGQRFSANDVAAASIDHWE